MEISHRVKYLRKDVLKINQDDFSKKIGLSRSNIANIETGRVKLTDRTISDICREFNINEHWLRTGKGEMELTMDSDEEFMYLVGQFSAENDEYKKRIIRAMLSIEDRESWELITKMVEKLSSLENLKKE